MAGIQRDTVHTAHPHHCCHCHRHRTLWSLRSECDHWDKVSTAQQSPHSHPHNLHKHCRSEWAQCHPRIARRLPCKVSRLGHGGIPARSSCKKMRLPAARCQQHILYKSHPDQQIRVRTIGSWYSIGLALRHSHSGYTGLQPRHIHPDRCRTVYCSRTSVHLAREGKPRILRRLH